MQNITIPEVFPEELYNEQMKNVEALFSESAPRLFFESFDGKKISYIFYPADRQDALGTIVIAHGLSEFAEKYTELAYYFTRSGFDVFSIEHRGHGYSYRECPDSQATHIDDFRTYQQDFEFFISNVVAPAAKTGKIFLFGHSMGCTIECMFLESSHSASLITASVMCAPMMSFSPRFVSDNMLRNSAKKSLKKTEEPFSLFKYTSKPFNPDPVFVKSGDTSYNRFFRNLNKRRENDLYKNSKCTNAWIFSACNAVKDVTKNAKKISVPVLMMLGELDSVIKRSSQIKLAKNISGCELRIVKEAKHSIFTSESPNLTRSLAVVLGYYAKYI